MNPSFKMWGRRLASIKNAMWNPFRFIRRKFDHNWIFSIYMVVCISLISAMATSTFNSANERGPASEEQIKIALTHSECVSTELQRRIRYATSPVTGISIRLIKDRCEDEVLAQKQRDLLND